MVPQEDAAARCFTVAIPAAQITKPAMKTNQQNPTRLTVRRGAIGILHDRGRYLLVQRAEGISKAEMWCFPGGHVEAGETSRSAIVRELHEELGISTAPRRRLGSVRTPDGTYVLAAWLFGYSGEPLRVCRAEIKNVKWLTPSEIRRHPNGLTTNDQVLAFLDKA